MWRDKLNSLGTVGELKGEASRLFEQLLNSVAGEAVCRRLAFPVVSIWDAPDRVHVEAEVPGVRMEDMEVFVTERELTIKGQRPLVPQDRQYHKQERAGGTFQRTIELPVSVDPEQVNAILKLGVLHINMSKSTQEQPRRITPVDEGLAEHTIKPTTGPAGEELHGPNEG